MADVPDLSYVGPVSGSRMASRTLSGVLGVLALAAVLLLAGAAWAQRAEAAASYPTGFSDKVIASGLGAPTGVAWTPDGRMFVAEKDGKLEVVNPGSTTPIQVLDISSRVNHAADRGLLSVAVDANYAVNNYVYLLYTYDLGGPLMPDGDGPMVSRLERFRITPGNVATFDKVLLGSYVAGPCPTARNDLDCIPSDDLSHSIGTVRAAPDGTLWVGSGDAASFGDVDRLALRTYDEQSMAGKIMHIDRDGKALAGHPFCPANNSPDAVCAKLYAKGFRNPYRFTLRPNGGGLVVGDVGWNQREEVDVISQGGGNYGWPCYEAGQRTPDYREWPECEAEYAKEGTADAHIGPSYEYPHPIGNTVIGGPTYTGQRYPSSMDGDVFYGDYKAKTIRRLVLDGQGQVVDNKDFAENFEGMVGIEQAPNGNLVGVDIGTFNNDGVVREIVYQGREPEALASATPTSGPTPLTVDFTGSASYDADSDDLTFDWDFGDGTAHGTTENPRHVYTTAGTYTATLTVTDREGNSDTATVTIRPGNDAPTAAITSPADNSLYRGGSTISLSGTGTDRQDGGLGGSALSWNVVLHHGDHVHPLHQATGAATSFTAATDHDADSYYEITLTAKDSTGLTGSRSIVLRPETAQARINSTPAGAPITYSGRDFTAPLNTPTAIGFRTSLSAAATFVRDGRTFYFDRWSDGGARTRNGVAVPPEGLDLRAYYREDKSAGKSATASSTEGGHDPGDALDGDPATYWGSSFANNQWWQVDLGSQRQVDQVRLDWTAAYPTQYKIQTSANGSTWADATTVSLSTVPHGSPKGVVETTFPARAARYVRILSLTRATEWGNAFFDARVLGPADTVLPDTAITSGPSGTSQQSRTASWAFSGDAGATFECKLDSGTWQACTSPKSVPDMTDGTHTFQVRAVNDAGEDPTPATRTVTVDNAAPDTNITGGPSGTIRTRTASLTFTGTETGGTFECKLDNAATWEACSSPKDLTALADGSHTFQVRAKDAAGNVDGSPASRTFSVDATEPETTINSGPANGSTSNNSPSFAFSSEAGATFECQLDGSTWATCTSPRAYTGLSGGQHTFSVRAKDTNGNQDSTPASRTFTVDATEPQTSFTLTPPALTKDTSVSYSFSSEIGATFECKLDSGAFAPCTSPKQLTGLTPGSHTFSVRAKDTLGNVESTPASHTFTVDTAAPDTNITGGPSGTITSRSASVPFTATETGSTFECQLDSGAWTACSSPKDLTALADGSHTFRVRAKDAAGNQDASPASLTFSVDTTMPETRIDAGPTGTITTTGTSFRFSATGVAAAYFECRLDSATTWRRCTSPDNVTGLGQGNHSYEVRATSAAGNTDSTPAKRDFKVDSVAPNTTIGSGPTGDITATSATFGFTSEAGASFQCKLDAGAWAACTSPKTFSGLSVAAHTVQVRARDAAGNFDASPATRSFRVVDRTPPNTTITSGPSGTVSGSSQRFTFSSEAGATFQCKLDAGAWAACASPKTFSGLSVAAHTVQVRARDAAGNFDASPATRSFRVAAAKVAPLDSYQATVRSTAGLTALYGLADRGGTARANAARPGTYHGGPRRVKPLVSRSGDAYARHFDGRDDWIALDPRVLTRGKAFSAELWLEFATPRRGGLVTLFGTRGTGFGLNLDALGRPVASLRPGTGKVAGPKLRRRRRHHVVVTFDGRRLRAYADGKAAGSRRSGAIGRGRGTRLALGRTFRGSMDEVAFYDRALSAADVRTHYRAGR